MKRDSMLALAKGAATYVPGLYAMLRQRRMLLEGVTAEYSYGLWFKHFSRYHKLTGRGTPEVVAELGPGDTLGTGIAALLSGASRYVGADTLPFANVEETATVGSRLPSLFHARHAPEVRGFPDYRDALDERGFLSAVLSDEILKETLEQSRVDAILSDACKAINKEKTKHFSYFAPYDASSIEPASIDFLFSHSVLEHITDLPTAMRAVHGWLKPGAVMSHQFDQRSHGLTQAWDGHRHFEDMAWKVVVGKRPFLINRLTFSDVIRIIEEAGFRILTAERDNVPPTMDRDELCAKWRSQSDEELSTSSGFVQAQKI